MMPERFGSAWQSRFQTKGQVLARLIHSQQALADLERLTDCLLETDSIAPLKAIELISNALQILKNHPLIGRPAEYEKR